MSNRRQIFRIGKYLLSLMVFLAGYDLFTYLLGWGSMGQEDADLFQRIMQDWIKYVPMSLLLALIYTDWDAKYKHSHRSEK